MVKQFSALSSAVNRPPLLNFKNLVLNPALKLIFKPNFNPQDWLLLASFFITLGLTSSSTLAAPNNSLAKHASPYLAMHGRDPVNWQLWRADILKKAKTENKLIFISSGYFSCHWCHVMQKENYLHPPTANFINQHFIPVKIDRELNPELDKTLIEFATKATGQAGWPQHVILTPEGYPFAAFVYLPNRAFNQTLQKITKAWQSQPNQIRLIAQNAISKVAPPKATSLTAKQFETKLLQQVDHLKDDLSGGLTGTTKFPEAPLLNALLQITKLPESIEEWLLLTLDQMQSQHLFDHVHGGFYRYTVDPEWQTPHFEKMAYNNALLADIYLQAGQRFKRKDYLQTAVETLNYLETHLYNANTQLYQSSQSAIDSDNKEGGDYLWSKKMLQERLSIKGFRLIEQAWSLQNSPPYDLGWHPKRFDQSAEFGFSVEQLLWPIIRKKLQTDPANIPIDSKSILGWNGLVLSAYSRAYIVLQNPKYLQKANTLANRLQELIIQAQPPRALSKTAEPMGRANLQDYAFIYQGLQNWQAATGAKDTLSHLTQLEKIILSDFYSSTGWQYDSAPLLPGQRSEWQMHDNAIPSPTAIVSCLADNTLAYASEALLKRPIIYASYLPTLKQCSTAK